MFDKGELAGGRVWPLTFKVIPEDGSRDRAARNGEEPQQETVARSSGQRKRRKRRPLAQVQSTPDGKQQDHFDSETGNETMFSTGPRVAREANFSLEFSYPAVILEDVCFSVDRSQQQSNFLNECLFRLNKCFMPMLALYSKQASDEERAHLSQYEKVKILKSVNLSVPHGSIFGLLGPSSCGKTTLLRCLVGLLKPSTGVIRLFGQTRPTCNKSCAFLRLADLIRRRRPSAANNCKIPGVNVGYMPQDLGLYEDFTINQLLTMFGRYMQMERWLIKARVKFMANFLELPKISRKIQTLSGGQKRRVSFAIACLHMPPLIILDEPTVGVDPLLRQSIWRYLRRLASEENCTIIITTHYIEEAAQADQVALMRAGEILIQDTPSQIMETHNARTLEEAFLKICNNAQKNPNEVGGTTGATARQQQRSKNELLPQRPFEWRTPELEGQAQAQTTSGLVQEAEIALNYNNQDGSGPESEESVVRELRLKAQEKLAIYDKLKCCRDLYKQPVESNSDSFKLEGRPQLVVEQQTRSPRNVDRFLDDLVLNAAELPDEERRQRRKRTKEGLLRRSKQFMLNDSLSATQAANFSRGAEQLPGRLNGSDRKFSNKHMDKDNNENKPRLRALHRGLVLFWALLYKNYRRNVNSIPLLAFQFMLPMIQMISFSLCVGGRPSNVGLGVVNRDDPFGFAAAARIEGTLTSFNNTLSLRENDALSLKYLDLIDGSMLTVRPYSHLNEALADVRRAKLWAAMEIGENFTTAIARRFDLENFYQLDLATVHQSVIKLYPDRSNKILDMICHRSLIDSYRKFLSTEFEHFKRMPIEIARPIFEIEPNVISNSIDGYTESIAPGLLASLTYIMAAGLTTFIMVVERSAGILERTYTSGISPVSYLLAHAIFRSIVMMIQIAFVLVLTFYVLRQPLVGSIWLAYSMLMVLNITGITYGLLISSIVTDQNGAALTIVSSLVVKITLSGILWPFEAIPVWLRTICYMQPLTMPVQALKAITLKGASLGDRSVNLGFLVSVSWFLVFLTIATKRFKFYQH